MPITVSSKPPALVIPQKAELSDIESFVDTPEGTSTLTIRCASNRIVTFVIKRDKIKELNLNSLYDRLLEECVR